MRPINNKKPIPFVHKKKCELRGRLITDSIATNTRRPPSSAGIGNRLKTARLIDSNPTKYTKSEIPCCKDSCAKVAIPIGPDRLSTPSPVVNTPTNSSYIACTI